MTRIEKIGTNRKKLSINWAWGNEGVETLDAMTGKLQDKGASRILKKALFSIFTLLCKASYRLSYKKISSQYTEYQHSNKSCFDTIKKI